MDASVTAINFPKIFSILFLRKNPQNRISQVQILFKSAMKYF